jgi:hypothetical protein
MEPVGGRKGTRYVGKLIVVTVMLTSLYIVHGVLKSGMDNDQHTTFPTLTTPMKNGNRLDKLGGSLLP